MGLMSMQGFMSHIGNLVKKLGFIPTLKELYDLTGKTLVISVSNVTKMKSEYYTPLTKPNINSITAIELSCNLPIIFQRIFLFEGDYIVDGGCLDNFPHKHIDDGKMKILAIVTTGTDFLSIRR